MKKFPFVATGIVLLGLGFSQIGIADPQIIKTQDCPNCAQDNNANGSAPINNPPAVNPGDPYNGEQDNNSSSDFDSSQDFGQDQSFDDDNQNRMRGAPGQNPDYNRNNAN